MTVPFVGRKGELGGLRALVSTARREGAPVVGLVTGEPGTGKSRLLRQVTAGLDEQRCVILTGFEPTESIPLSAAADVVRRLAGVPEHGPRLRDLAFAGRGATGEGALQVFEAANRAAGAFGQLILVVDDLQWVDTRSLALVHYLVDAAESARRAFVVIAAARPSPAAVSFTEGVVRPRAEGRRLLIELGGLDLDDGVALVQALDETMDAASASVLWRRAAGNPFWLEALARDKRSTDSADLLAARLRALGGDAAALLNALVVGARPFAPEELGQIVGWHAERLDHSIRELVGRGLAINELGHLRLAHDLIRETASQAIPTSTRRSIHARLAALLEGAAGESLGLLVEALDHRAAAGLPTSDLAIRIVRSPQRRLLGPDDLRRLSAIAEMLDAGSPAQLELDTGLGQLAGVLGDQELALRHWLRSADHERTPGGRQRAALEAALASFRLARPTDAHAHLDLARRSAPETPVSRAQIEALDAEIALWVDHDTAAGAAAAGRALSAAREAVAAAGGIDRLPAETRRAFVGALEASIGAAMQEERFDDIRSLTAEILPASRALGAEVYVAGLLRSGFALRPLGALREAENVYRAAWDIAHREVLPFPMIDAGIGLARALRDLGRLRESREVALETLQLEARLGSPPGRWGNASATLHATEVSLGESHGLSRLQADGREHPNPHFRLWIHQTIAVWQARLNGSRSEGEVEVSLAAGRADAAIARCPRCAGELAVASVEALARIGRVEEARRELERWEERAVAEYPWQGVLRARAQASIAMAEGNRSASVAHLEQLQEALAELDLLDDLVWAFLDLGAVQSNADRAAAVAAYTSAAALADRLGATSRARLASQALRQLGVRAWRRGPRAPGAGSNAALSLREQEVADLVAGGATNLEVGETLAISSKTVERHLTNILAKVGARNRTELAARLRSGGTGFPR